MKIFGHNFNFNAGNTMKKLMITGTVLTLVLATGTIVYATNRHRPMSHTASTTAATGVTSTTNTKAAAVTSTTNTSTNNHVSTDHRTETKGAHSQHGATEHNGTGNSATDESTHPDHDTAKENNHSEHSTTEHSSSANGNEY